MVLFCLKAEHYVMHGMKPISYNVIWTSTVPFDTNNLYVESLSRRHRIESRRNSTERDSGGQQHVSSELQ